MEVDQTKVSDSGNILSFDKYGVLLDEDLETQERRKEKLRLIKEQELIDIKMA